MLERKKQVAISQMTKLLYLHSVEDLYSDFQSRMFPQATFIDFYSSNKFHKRI